MTITTGLYTTLSPRIRVILGREELAISVVILLDTSTKINIIIIDIIEEVGLVV